METGRWRLARGWREIVLISDSGDERVVEVASGVPPTGGSLDLTLGPNTAPYELDEDGTLRCLYFDGAQVLWTGRIEPEQSAPETLTLTEYVPGALSEATDAPEGCCGAEAQEE